VLCWEANPSTVPGAGSKWGVVLPPPACPAFRSPQGHLAFQHQSENPGGLGDWLPQFSAATVFSPFHLSFLWMLVSDSSAGLQQAKSLFTSKAVCGAASSTRRGPIWRPARTWPWACCASWSYFDEAFGGLAFAHQQRGRLGERPFRCALPIFLWASLLTCRPTRGSLAPGGVGDKVARRRRSDGCRGLLVQQTMPAISADAGHGFSAGERCLVVDLGVAFRYSSTLVKLLVESAARATVGLAPCGGHAGVVEALVKVDAVGGSGFELARRRGAL